MLLLIAAPGFTQKCKYEINQKDPFSQKFYKQTKTEQVGSTFYTAMGVAFAKEDSAYYLVLEMMESSYSKFDPWHITEKQQLQILLTSGKTITLHAQNKKEGVRGTVIGIPPVYTCKVEMVRYKISEGDLMTLMTSAPTLMRVYKTMPQGSTEHQDMEIKTKKHDNLQNLISCVL